MAHRLGCSAACGIFPDQGLNPCPLHWQDSALAGGFLTTVHQGSPFFFNFYLFIWLRRALIAAHGIFVVAHGLLSSCGTWALEHAGSVVAAHGLSCPTLCGILVPRPGIEPASPALEGGFLTTVPPGKSQCQNFQSRVLTEVQLNFQLLPAGRLSRSQFTLEIQVCVGWMRKQR